ncbi:MAG TPA: dimethyladenosine transferase [Acidimicrobiales bacterium]|jgi:hypothetical protein|nr:dimethyladenosine transferase [Acidimicrobiales bacterium]
MGEPVEPVKVSRRIEASAADIFRVLSDPTKHLAIDGSGMLRGAETASPITRKGDVFVMNMYFSALGEYQMDNHVVEFEADRRIGWEPVAGKGHPEIGGRVGHRWSYWLTPDGPDATVVTEIYDCSSAPIEFRRGMNNGEQWRKDMEATLQRLDEAARGS